MSFNNCKNEKVPGPIMGNPINGLCEKVCITAKKVFDACMIQLSNESVDVTLTNLDPSTYTAPLTFISSRNATSKGTISNLMVDPLDDRPQCSRVRATVGVPIEVIYVDANGIEGSGEAVINIPVDVVMGVPEAAIIPYEIESVVGSVAPQGTYVSETTFNLTTCITVIIKSVTEVDLLVPSYGYAYIPPAQNYTQDVCSGFFELPLFPGSTRMDNRS